MKMLRLRSSDLAQQKTSTSGPSCRSLIVLYEVVDGAWLPGLLRAIRTAKNIIFGLDTVADYFTSAMRTGGSQFMYCAFKRIEYMPAPGC